jgi:hypothetical protein
VSPADPIGGYRLQEARLLAGEWLHEALDVWGFSLAHPTIRLGIRQDQDIQRLSMNNRTEVAAHRNLASNCNDLSSRTGCAAGD